MDPGVDPGEDPGVDPDATSRCGTVMDLVFWLKSVVIQVGFLRHILLVPVVDPGVDLVVYPDGGSC